MTSATLFTDCLGIRFGGHVAVDAVSCEFHAGTVTAIVGPNGAGKTTYFNLISGQLRATSGSVHLLGENVTRWSASQRVHVGLGRAFQLTQLFPKLSVAENVRLAVQSRRDWGINFWSHWRQELGVIRRADELLDAVRLADKRDQPAASLAHGDQRKLEVAILMALDAEVFMLDEPTAGMSLDETPVILDLIRAIKAEGNKTILLVEHKMDVVRELADRIIVLHNGQLVADGTPEVVMASSIVREAYLGVAPEEGWT